MEYFVLKYANFSCKFIVENNNTDIVYKFINDFKRYYNVSFSASEDCEAQIWIVEDAFEGIIKGEKVCIHGSHSKNIKYLLDGTVYTQKDAAIYANVRKSGNYLFYYIEDMQIKILVDIINKTVRVSGTNLYNIVVYIFESLLCNYIEHKGGIHIHGACCEFKNKGYIFTGKSGGGKTTLLFEVLKHGGAFHSNDRVALFESNDGVIAYSIPIPVNVPIETMRTLEQWKDSDLIKNAKDKTKIRFMVPELETLFGNKTISMAKLDKIIVVNYSNTAASLEKLNNHHAIDCLDVLSPYDENHPKWLPLFSCPVECEVKEKLKKINAKVPIIKISGENTYSTFENNCL